MQNRISWVALLLLLVSTAQGAYLLEIDTDGLDDGVLTYNPGFSFGGDTTTASQSAAGSAFGLTGGDSIFGGDGIQFPDTYVYTYNPTAQADNLVLAAGQDLGAGNIATGAVGGGAGLYRVYATWPFTTNVSGGLTTYSIETLGDSDSISLDQNDLGDVWVLLGTISYTSGNITVTQRSATNTFVSMRAAGVLFEKVERDTSEVPEPATVWMMLSGVGAMVVAVLRRRQSVSRV